MRGSGGGTAITHSERTTPAAGRIQRNVSPTRSLEETPPEPRTRREARLAVMQYLRRESARTHQRLSGRPALRCALGPTMTFTGPSKTIVSEPLEAPRPVPVPVPAAPAPAPPQEAPAPGA